MEPSQMLLPFLTNTYSTTSFSSSEYSFSLLVNRKRCLDSSHLFRMSKKCIWGNTCYSTKPVEQSLSLEFLCPLYNGPEHIVPMTKVEEHSLESSWATPSSNTPSCTTDSTTAIIDHKEKVFTGVSRSGVAGRWRSQLCKDGKTVHLGTFSTADDAARAWDRAAVAERGHDVVTNFPINEYLNEDGTIKKSTVDSASKAETKKHKEFRGVYNSGTYGRWKARIVVNGKKLHLGTFADPADAARAWDRRAILFRGVNTQINFDISEYADEVDTSSVGYRGERLIRGSSDMNRANPPRFSSTGKRQQREIKDSEGGMKRRCLASLASEPIEFVSKCPSNLTSPACSPRVDATHITVLPSLKNLIAWLSLCDEAAEMP